MNTSTKLLYAKEGQNVLQHTSIHCVVHVLVSVLKKILISDAKNMIKKASIFLSCYFSTKQNFQHQCEGKKNIFLSFIYHIEK